VRALWSTGRLKCASAGRRLLVGSLGAMKIQGGGT